MRAGEVVTKTVARLEADAQLLTLLGNEPRIYRAGAVRNRSLPSVEWTMVSAVQREIGERVLIQFSIFASRWDTAVAIAGRLRALLHRDLPESVGGLPMWLQLVAQREHGDPDHELVHHSLDFLFEPARIDR